MSMLRLFTVLVAVLLSVPALADPRVALVGNSNYEFVPALDNPTNDAKLMADTLQGLGFTLVGGGPQLNLDEAAFDKAVQTSARNCKGADVGLFYHAGHGVQVRGSNYLAPINANPTREADVDFQMLDAALVLRQMESAGTRLNLVILDACRNNPFGGRGLRASGRGLAQMQAPEGTLISYATQPGNVAQDGADVYGPDNLLDGNDATAWVEGSSGQGVDDYLVLEFDALQSVSGLTIRNGDDKNRDIYGKNSGVKDVELRFSAGDRLETTLKDDPAPQHVALSRPIKAKWVQLIVRSVYPGWKYSDTAINEVRVDVQ
jgi:hypothetical protein